MLSWCHSTLLNCCIIMFCILNHFLWSSVDAMYNKILVAELRGTTVILTVHFPLKLVQFTTPTGSISSTIKLYNICLECVLNSFHKECLLCMSYSSYNLLQGIFYLSSLHWFGQNVDCSSLCQLPLAFEIQLTNSSSARSAYKENLLASSNIAIDV